MKKLLIEIGKVITSIIVIGSSALWLDGKFDNSNDKLEEIQTTVDYNSIELSMLGESVNNIEDTLLKFEDEHRAQGEQIKSLAWGLNHIEQFEPQDFEDIMNEMLKKNNGWSMMPIALPGVSSILYEIDTELIGVK